MQEDESEQPEQLEIDLDTYKKPDESGNILVDEHIKIFDPNTDEVLINKRGES